MSPNVGCPASPSPATTSCSSGPTRAAIAPRVDPDGNTYTLLGCKSPTNDGRYCAGAEADLLAGQAETDPARRHELYQSAITTIVDDRPIIYLYHPPLIMGMTARLNGFVYHPDGLIRLRDVAYAP